MKRFFEALVDVDWAAVSRGVGTVSALISGLRGEDASAMVEKHRDAAERGERMRETILNATGSKTEG